MTTYPQLSCVPVIYFRAIVLEHTMELEDWFPIAASLDVTGTEIHYRSLRSANPDYVDRIASAAGEMGLQVSQLIISPDLCHPDPDQRAAEIADVVEAVDVACHLNATCVRLTAGQAHPGAGRERAITWAAASFREVLPYAEERGVHLAFENHYKDYFWKQPDISQVGEVFLEIVRRLVDTPLRINFDTGNPLMIEEDPLPLLRAVRDRVVHVHCSDRYPGRYEHVICGQGGVDFPALFRLLKEIDYAGWLSIEYNGSGGLQGLRSSIDYVRRTWQES